MENRKLQITDLTLMEQRENSGGIIWEELVKAAIISVINDWDNFKAVLAGKPEIVKK